MKSSIVLTVLNEGKTIDLLLRSITSQTIVPDEVVIVDAGSVDETIETIKEYKSKIKQLKLIVKKGASRSCARNLCVEAARYDTVAMTDAGCILTRRWLERMIKPLKNREVGIVAGFYKMAGNSCFQKAVSIYLGVLPKDYNRKFLPSARSLAFRKMIWREVGGFPEDIKGAGEDTVFNLRVLEHGYQFALVKNAIVIWNIPNDLVEFAKKIFNYAAGDSKSRIFWSRHRGFETHNVKAILIFVRYLLGISVLLLIAIKGWDPIILYFAVSLYLFWSFSKVYNGTKKVKSGVFGPILQITSDFAVMLGFIKGILF